MRTFVFPSTRKIQLLNKILFLLPKTGKQNSPSHLVSDIKSIKTVPVKISFRYDTSHQSSIISTEIYQNKDQDI